MITVLLADKNLNGRRLMKKLINSEDNMKVIAEVDHRDDIFHVIKTKLPNIVILNIVNCKQKGLNVIREIKNKLDNDVKVIVTANSDEQDYILDALKIGASGYVINNSGHLNEEIIRAIKFTYVNDTYICPLASKIILKNCTIIPNDYLKQKSNEQIQLSKRENEILLYLASGYTNQEIANKLFISVKTVESHRSKIRRKLNVQTRYEMVQYVTEKLGVSLY